MEDGGLRRRFDFVETQEREEKGYEGIEGWELSVKRIEKEMYRRMEERVVGMRRKRCS